MASILPWDGEPIGLRAVDGGREEKEGRDVLARSEATTKC